MSSGDDSLDRKRRLDEIADRFEEQLKQDPRFRVESFLDQLDEDEKSDVLSELIGVEIELRDAAGQSIDRHEYFDRFPNSLTAIELAFAHVDEVDVVVATRVSEAPGDEDFDLADTNAHDVPGRLGRFKIEQRVGAGSFGVVFRAVDTESGETVALKFPRRRTIESASQLRQFLLEAEHASRLKHPGIVPTYGAEQADGFVVIVQRFIDGCTLRELFKQTIDLRRGVELVARIAEAAAFAHQHGYIHRDLKPANILVDSRGNPFIADFGLVLHIDRQPDARGELCGAPVYMSPEQVQGLAHRLDGRSDIWSLGVMLYELLTHRRPFRGARAASFSKKLSTANLGRHE